MSSFVSVFFGKQKVQIGVGVGGDFLPAGAIEFDASVNEDHEAENDVTEFPVEEGADITDHIRPRPESITINGIVSNTPLTLLPIEPRRAEEAYDKLKTIKDTGQLVSIVTSLRRYDNMAITSLSVVRNAQNGNVVNATVRLREVFLAQTETVIPEPPGTATTGPVDTGAQSATPASAAVTQKSNDSLLFSFGQSLAGG
ncbi:MAG: hypothetical protein MJA83_05640 [Gammaproteobacteria bacterium]|nr:hypothetical protein [Gammaproteobacteria bacterium]